MYLMLVPVFFPAINGISQTQEFMYGVSFEEQDFLLSNDCSHNPGTADALLQRGASLRAP